MNKSEGLAYRLVDHFNKTCGMVDSPLDLFYCKFTIVNNILKSNNFVMRQNSNQIK